MKYTVLKAFGLFLVLVLISGCAGDQGAESPGVASGDSASADTMGRTAIEPAAADTVQKINLNTASGDEFRTIPNVGDRMVHEFEEYRPYVSIQQFRREIGKYVDEEQVAAYEQYVFVPIDPNESDRESLMQVPGLDDSEAASLIEERPFSSREAFLDALGSFVSAEELRTADRYVD